MPKTTPVVSARMSWLDRRQPLRAALYDLAIIGETLNKVSGEIKSAAPDLPWRPLADLRNFIVHAYWQVDLEIVAEVIKNRLDPLIVELDRLIGFRRTFGKMTLIVKICGLSTPEALDVALDAGADMVGFVFFPPSPRHLGFEAAKLLGARVPRTRAESGADGRCRRCDARRRRRCAASPTCCSFMARSRPSAWRRANALRPAGDEGDRRSRREPTCRRPALRRRCRPPVVRRARAARGDAAGRSGQTVRLAPSGKSRSRHAVHAVGRARCRQRRRGPAITRAPGVDVSSGVERAPGRRIPKNPRLRARGACRRRSALAAYPVTSPA